MSPLNIAGHSFESRLFLGTGKFSSYKLMAESILASGSQLVTVALKRVELHSEAEDEMLHYIQQKGVQLMPNTSGVRNAKEAIFLAKMAQQALGTNWLKLEIHPDPRYLLPDPIETLIAAEELVKAGFIVMPYINADPVLCKRLEDVGVASVMPLGAPIGSNRGLQTLSMLEIIIKESRVPVIVDAGIGMPSHAAMALEIGADAVLVNTAIAIAKDPIKMSDAFKKAVEAGRSAFEYNGSSISFQANPSSPISQLINGL